MTWTTLRAGVVCLSLTLLPGCVAEPDAPQTRTAAPSPFAATIDCANTGNDTQKMVCNSPELTRLDHQLADEYQHALTEPGADRATLEAAQRGWASGRDDCSTADDLHRCVLESYRTRLVELKIDDPDTVKPETVTFRCPDHAKPLTAQYYPQFDPPAAVLTWGADRAVVFGADRAVVFGVPAGSGSRYGRDGVDFWEHQGEVAVDFYGNKFVCLTP